MIMIMIHLAHILTTNQFIPLMVIFVMTPVTLTQQIIAVVELDMMKVAVVQEVVINIAIHVGQATIVHHIIATNVKVHLIVLHTMIVVALGNIAQEQHVLQTHHYALYHV